MEISCISLVTGNVLITAKKEPDSKIIHRYDDDWVNIVFTGRVVPNKCPQDIIAAFYYSKIARLVEKHGSADCWK